MFTTIESNEKLYYKILKQIQSKIFDGSLSSGDKLPPERQMAMSLGVSRPALKQALSILESMNIIECRQGDGNYILPFQKKILNPIIKDFYSKQGTLEDVLEVRYILEVQTSKILAQKITENQINELYTIVEEMKTVHELQDRILLNNKFHSTMMNFCGNPLIIAFYNSIVELIGMQISMTDGKNFQLSHMAIVDALKMGNPNEIELVMSNHFINKFPNYQYYISTITELK